MNYAMGFIDFKLGGLFYIKQSSEYKVDATLRLIERGNILKDEQKTIENLIN